jgi:hypothetical protein
MTAKNPIKTLITVAAVAAFATFGSPAFAQQAASAPTSAAKKALIQNILQMQQPGFEAAARQLTEQSVAPIEQQVSMALRTRVAEDQRKVVAAQVEGDIKAFVDAVGPQLREISLRVAPTTVGTILEQNFNEDELKQLIELLQSPVSRKFNQLAPQMQQALAQKIIDEAKPGVTPKLIALQETLMRRLGIAAPGAASSAPTAAASAKPAPSAARPAAAKASAAVKK